VFLTPVAFSKPQTKLFGGDGYDETAKVAVEMVLLLSTKRDE